MLENPYGLTGCPPQQERVPLRELAGLPAETLGRTLSPGRDRKPSFINALAQTRTVTAGLPGLQNGAIKGSEVRQAMARGPIRGESRMEYIPYERKYIDYESVERIQKVPIERTVIDYQEQKKIDYVPRQRTITDYYAIEHQVTYVPRSVPETKIEYVPVQTVVERVEYIPVQRQVVHYPDDFQFGRSPQPNLASPFTGVKGSSVKPFSATLQQPTITVNPAEPLEIESRFIAGANLQRASRESPFSVSRQYDKLTPLNSTQRDSNGFSSVPSMTRQTNSSIVQAQMGVFSSNYQPVPNQVPARALPKIHEQRDLQSDHSNIVESLHFLDSDKVLKGLKTNNTGLQDMPEFKYQKGSPQRSVTPLSHAIPHNEYGQMGRNNTHTQNGGQTLRPTSSHSKRVSGIRLTLSKERGRRSSSQAPHQT